MKIVSKLNRPLLVFFIFTHMLFAQGKRVFTPLDSNFREVINIHQGKHLTRLTAEDLWNMKRLSSLTISPDGKFGCFVVTEYNIKDNKGNSDLWLIDLKTYQTKKLTTNLGSDGSPTWHPNSKSIAFISKREGDYSQLYTIPIDGGEASLLAEMPMGISSPKYFQDGKKIAFVSQILPEHENDFSQWDAFANAMKKAIKEKKENKMTAKVTENRFYRYWDGWLTDGYVSRIFVYDIEKKEKVDVTKGSTRIFNFDGGITYSISPDGKWISYSANNTQLPYDELNSDVFLIGLDGSSSEINITSKNPQEDGSPVFSNDSKFLFYGMQNDPDYSADNVKLVKYDITNRTEKVLTTNYDYSFGDFKESKDGSSMFMLSDVHARSAIFSLDLKSNKLDKLYNEGGIISLNHANEKLYFLKNNLASPTDIFEFDLKTKKLKQISDFNRTLLDQIEFGKYENLYFEGADNQEVQMFLLYPPNFDASKKYPLVHLIHGGPHGTFGDDFHPRWNAQLFASPGYVVAMVNFHGSTSFGNKFGKSIVGAHGDKPFTDIMKATDYLIKKYSFIDGSKLGAAGGSYGGYLVNWIAGHTDRFNALISHAGVYNLMGQFASDLTHERVKNYDGAPWEGKYENINRYSPAHFAHNFKTPMLVIHGEKDYRVVITQGLEIYGVLKGKGVDARLIYYPNENHWILTPQNSIYWYKEVHDWFARYLLEKEE
ncbi:MAG: S9 family peptidase [Ignavibacteria bacterium]|nr:S9 family peptidase [Ignavibacteria bacterium]